MPSGWQVRPLNAHRYEPALDEYPLRTIRGTYEAPPVEAPREGCRKCPRVDICAERAARRMPLLCGAPLDLELDATRYYAGSPPRLPPSLFPGPDMKEPTDEEKARAAELWCLGVSAEAML